MKFIWPLDDHYITRDFDFKSSIYIGGQHAAVDLVRLQGDTDGRPIKASASGTVVGDDFNSISGNYITIAHEGGWRTTYRHLVADAPPVIGDQISQGQVIGNIGSTGWSTGPHLHFDLWHIDKQDPTAFFKVGWWAHNPELYLGQESDMGMTPEEKELLEIIQGQVNQLIALHQEGGIHHDTLSIIQGQTNQLIAQHQAIETDSGKHGSTGGGLSKTEVRAIAQEEDKRLKLTK